LQYRIGKLKELTGYDVRKPSENPALYMAYLIMQDIEMEKSETYALLHETK
jgi:carbohydrate diacid regulator